MKFKITVDKTPYEIEIGGETPMPTGVKVNGEPFNTKVEKKGDLLIVSIDDKKYEIDAKPKAENNYSFLVNGKPHDIMIELAAARDVKQAEKKPVPTAGRPAGAGGPKGKGDVTPPMPGKIIDLRVKKGDVVKAGQVLLVLEAMKMQNEILSPIDGTVEEIKCKVGDSVSASDVIVIVK